MSEVNADPPVGGHRHASGLTRVVGIGSSAGGLEALQVVLRHLPLGQRVSYVIAQHVSPHHRSLMAELLDKQTSLVVTQASDGQQLLPDHVFVTPPNSDVTLAGDRIRLSTPMEGHGPRPSIDGLFLSLAAQWQDAAVAILLSGTGDDGTYGMREVHASGGLTIAQDPDSAKYPSMPAAAIRAGVTDLVLAPEQMGGAVTTVLGPSTPVDATALPLPFVQRVMEQLRADGAGDFTHYKTGTLLRQIARRMAVLQLEDQGDYLTYLAANPVESRLLRQSILVSVTSFMRDPAAWSALADVLRKRWETRSENQQLRIWVPGCATGEEAYTLGMVVDDLLGHPGDLGSRVKIFATDLDEVSLDYARRATFPVQAISGLPEQWQQRYFTRRSGMAEVAGALRDATIFARHDIANDPSFVRLDLISFRNVLIYFDNSLQNRVLRAMHYSLRPEALLFLGMSEGVAGMHEWFMPLSSKYRIFERAAGVGAPMRIPETTPKVQPRVHPPRTDTSSLTREALIRALLPSGVLVDESERVIEIIGGVSEFLSLPQGHFDDRLSVLVREDLRVDARGLVVQARASSQPAATSVGRNGETIALRAIPLVTVAGVHVVVTFERVEPMEVLDEGDPMVVHRLQRELAGTREALQSTIEELETSNEELQATNEEMTAASEELQASNEELETINEELQATNEELGSLNQELQVRQHELTLANEDLSNIQDALSHALVIVDRDLRITRYSPLAVRVFALVESDLGRPLTAVPTTVDTAHLETAVKQVILSGQRATQQLAGDGHTYVVHVVPYRSTDGEIRGAILSISDLTEAAPIGDDATLALRAMTEGLDEVVWRRDETGQVTFINHAVLDLFGLTPEQVMSDPLAMDYAVHPEDLAGFTSLASNGRPRYLRYRVRAHGQVVEVEDFVHASVGSVDGGESIVGSIRRARASTGSAPTVESTVSALLAMPNQVVLLLDRSGVISAAGRSSAGLLGVTPAELEGRHLLGLIHEQDIGAVTRALGDNAPAEEAGAEDTASVAPLRVRILRRGGSIRWVDLLIKRLPEGAQAHHMMLLADVTADHDRALDLGRRLMFDATTGLLNRGAFIDALRIELIRQAPKTGSTAVLWLDLDGFKGINDHFGHATGDRVLLEVAQRLQGSCRPQDRVGRLGGDEFGVLITDCTQIDIVETTAVRIIEAMAAPIETPGGDTVTVGVSVGASLAPQDAQGAESLLNAADAAMYLAKRGGGNRIQYYKEGLNEEAAGRALMRQQLAEAIRNKAFTVVYQPILRASDGGVWGFEALARWQVDSRLVAAGEWIPTAERTGQIRLIGRQIQQMVIADLPALLELVSEATVCINVSVPELEDPHLMGSLLRDVPDRLLGALAVEITESALIGQDSPAMAALETLRRNGIAISLDDFGTGYANFASLDKVTPEVIKADRSFLDRAVSGVPRARSLLSAAVAMSDAVGAHSLAEGVSSSDHEHVAREIGVELMQGFHLGMPMPLEEIAAYVESRRR